MNKIVLILVIEFMVLQNVFSQTGWVRQYPGTNRNLSSVYFVNEFTGYIAGNTILKTTNGGINWFALDTSVLLGGASIHFITESTGFVGMYNRIYKTINGGLSWIYFQVSSQPVWSIFFINEFTGWAAIGFQFNGNIFKTTNAGMNWFNTLTSSGIGGVHFANINIGYAIGTYGEIYKSTNGGNNWINYNPGSSGSSDIQATDTNILYVSARYGRIRKSTDGGSTWVIQQTSSSTHFLGLYFVNSNTGWAVGGYDSPGKVIAKTTDGGTNWNIQISENSPRLHDVYFINSNTGWAVGDSGLILKTTTGGLTGLVPITNNVPGSFSLFQNYPNPFNPVTKIRFSIPLLRGVDAEGGRSVSVTLIIYDILGREVAILVNEQLKPGTYEVELDGTDYPSGVYFYKLITSEYTESKRMVLIK